LSVIDTNTGVSNNQAFTFQGFNTFSSTTSGTPGLLRYHHGLNANGEPRTIIEGTTDATAGVDIQVSLVGHLTLAASDFNL
jgi:hypothetical protein